MVLIATADPSPSLVPGSPPPLTAPMVKTSARTRLQGFFFPTSAMRVPPPPLLQAWRPVSVSAHVHPVAGDGRSPRTCSTAAAADIGPHRRHRVEIGWRWAEDRETYKIDTRMTMLQRTMRGEAEEETFVLFFLAT